jgi:hypothetical protein
MARAYLPFPSIFRLCPLDSIGLAEPIAPEAELGLGGVADRGGGDIGLYLCRASKVGVLAELPQAMRNGDDGVLGFAVVLRSDESLYNQVFANGWLLGSSSSLQNLRILV